MTWVLFEIVIPLLVAIGLGVIIGWLLWKWRRRSIHASEWNQLTTNANQAQADVAATRAAYEEANNERAMIASQLSLVTNDLEAARESESSAILRSDGLAADLVITQHELSQATEENESIQAELLAASSSAAKRDKLEANLGTLRDKGDQETAQLREELESAALRRSHLEQAVEEREHELKRTLGELNELTRRTETLSGEVESSVTAAALATNRIDDAEAKAGELEAALAAARTELDVSQSRIADFDARLATSAADLDAAQARVDELEARSHEEATAGTEVIGQLRVELAERDRRITALEAASTAVVTDASTIAMSTAEHIDDLKVIRGIGPRMEELLTTLGITSWEQLAELDEAGIARVDNALREFPGRIERDGWVDQARDLVSEFPSIGDRPTHATFVDRTS